MHGSPASSAGSSSAGSSFPGSPASPVLVALATCAELPHGDEDDAELISALAAAGVAAEWVVWDDEAAQWSRYGAVVIRSTWDYTGRRVEFLDWATRLAGLGVALENSVEVLRWNSDKTYLRDLASAGIPIVTTTWVEVGDTPVFPAGEYVVKPSVGAGSMGAARFDSTVAGDTERAREHVEMLHAAGRTVMIQPYLAQVDDVGERALLYFDGVHSHAITKAALLGAGAANPLRVGTTSRAPDALFMAERIQPAEASTAELAVAEQVLALLGDRLAQAPLYARVDLLPSPDGPCVIELELTEPSLFFGYSAGSVQSFAAAVALRVGAGVRTP